MENFYNWMSVPLPTSEVEVWFRAHNMIPERIDLYGCIFKSLSVTVIDTYLGDDFSETKVVLTKEDTINHFEWCWDRVIKDFEKENIIIDTEGDHKDYMSSFFLDSFYSQKEKNIRDAIPEFIDELFNLDKPFAKSDLDILTEIYKLLNKNVIHI
jgi:hypothetical protein